MGCGSSSSTVVAALPAPEPVAIATDAAEGDAGNPNPPNPADHQRRACKYGAGCYQRNAKHLSQFAHPGDRNYRKGFVTFANGKGPEFQTLFQCFSYFDTEESGYLDKENFVDLCQHVFQDSPSPFASFDEAWEDASQKGLHLNFSRFTVWSDPLGLGLPVGLDNPNAVRPCRFKFSGKDGKRCSCAQLEIGEDGFLCTCGHKPSMHRSDAAECSTDALRTAPDWWAENPAPAEPEPEAAEVSKAEGLVVIHDGALLDQLQSLLDDTHKKEDNWTRDRGCTIHGRNGDGCSLGCAFKNQVPTPLGYKLVTGLRNQSLDLWLKYFMMRSSIAEECASSHADKCPYEAVPVSSEADLDSPATQGCNEWRLFHGTRIEACRGICSSNFRLSLAGTGATWKDPGHEKGSPLYGFGIYLAEKCTKADEYSERVPFEALKDLLGEGSAETFADKELFCILVVRCVGGRTNIVTTNDIDKEQLKRDVFDGPHHSVFGDRVASLGKPYKEIVVYDKDQCYPEMLLLYERVYA